MNSSNYKSITFNGDNVKEVLDFVKPIAFIPSGVVVDQTYENSLHLAIKQKNFLLRRFTLLKGDTVSKDNSGEKIFVTREYSR